MRPSRIPLVTARRAIHLTLASWLIGASTLSIAADPKASKYFEDALTRYEKKDIPGAIIQLKNALQIDPTMLPMQVLLGKALLQNGEVAERVQNNSPVSKLLARIHLADGNSALAINVLEAYLRAQPGDGQALTLLATAHMAFGRIAKATALMQQALKTQPGLSHQAGY